MVVDRRTLTLDDAWSAKIAGQVEEAMGASLALFNADVGSTTTGHVEAGWLLLIGLADASRTKAIESGAGRLVDAALRRGDLPRAVGIAAWFEQAGRDAAPLRKQIAETFGRESPRLANVAPAPPPLPTASEPTKAKGEAIFVAADAVLAAFATDEDPHPAGSPIPRAPLFSALPRTALEKLLGAWKVRFVRAGEHVIEEGAEGREAYLVVRGRLRAERGAAPQPTVLAELGPGAIFGEMALVSDAPRAASVVSRDAAVLLVASRDALDRLARETPQIGVELSAFCRARMVSNLVRHSPILRKVDPQQRGAVVERFETRKFAVGEVLVEAGREVDGLFLIASGAVQVTSRDADGEALQVALLGPGDVVGEIGLVLRRPATATVVATHPTLALELKRERFAATIQDYPGLLAELYELATKREEETRTVVAQEALDVEGIVLL